MPHKTSLSGNVRKISLAAFLVSVLTPFVAVNAAEAPAPKRESISFFRYAIPSEPLSEWEQLAAIDKVGTNQLMGLFTLKSNSKTKLMAIRRDSDGGKVCKSERSTLNIEREPVEAIKSPRGWECVFAVKSKDRVVAVKTFNIKGPSRSTPFALVLVGESMPRERFMKALNSLKDVP